MKRLGVLAFLSVLELTILAATGSTQTSNEQIIKYGYIDKSGKMVIQPVFDYALPFREQTAAVKVAGKWGFIDTGGKIIIEPQFEWCTAFREGLATVKIRDENNKPIYLKINKKGNVVSVCLFR
jgi:WG containing repeat